MHLIPSVFGGFGYPWQGSWALAEETITPTLPVPSYQIWLHSCCKARGHLGSWEAL